ncbi:MAG: signal peptide peptidase SppA [bacterium]
MSNGKNITISIIIFLGILIAVISVLTLKYTFQFFQDLTLQNQQDYNTLHLCLSGSYPEAPTFDPWSFLSDRRSLTIEDLIQSINKASYDNDIDQIFITLYPLDIGWARISELRECLQDFKSSGKPIYVYMENAGDKEYYLASVADSIYLSPTGQLTVDGLSATVFFYKNLMNKLGIDWEVFKAGDFKSAPEIFTDTAMSEQYRASITQLLTETVEFYLTEVNQTREKQFLVPFKQILSQGPYLSANKAYHYRLVDQLDTKQNIMTQHQFQGYCIQPRDYLFSRWTDVPPPKSIALIFVEGEIFTGENAYSPFGLITGSRTISQAIIDASLNPEIKAIVLRINSPGGDINAAYEIGKAVELASQKKPVVASMSDMAASGGYFVAMYADLIVANQFTLTGSIGAFLMKPNLENLLIKIGVTVDTANTHPHSNFMPLYRDLTEKEKEIINNSLLEAYNLFITEVARCRDLDSAYVDSVAQGRVWSGYQAYNLHLVDTLGGLDFSIKLARDLAEIPIDQSVGIMIYPKMEFNFKKLNTYIHTYTDLSKILAGFVHPGYTGVMDVSLRELLSSAQLQTKIKYIQPDLIWIE